MKKLFIFIFLILGFFFISCDDNSKEVVENKYTVTYEMNGHGEQIESQELERLPNEFVIPSEEGFEFEGWFVDSECVNEAYPGTKLSSNITLYAKWYDMRFIISFDNKGKGEVVNSILAVKIPDNLPVLEDNDYVFEGWYYDEQLTSKVNPQDQVTSNITLYAKWVDQRVTVSFEPYRKGYKPKDILVAKIPSELPILDEEGYEFGGWYYDEEFTLPANSGDKLASNTKLYAKWTLITYSITYITNGHGDDVIVDGLLSIPDKLLKLKDENYVFEGWYLDEELTVKAETGIVMTENVTYYAKWLEASTDFSKQKESVVYNLSSGGYLDGKVEDFTKYVNTSAYVKVTNAKELAEALYNAKYTYTNNWNSETNSVEQVLTQEGSVHVIEIMNDINLGYNVIGDAAKANGIITNYIKSGQNPTSKMAKENGISQVKVENISNLLIYSANGAKLTHAGFKVTSCHNVVFRNLEMDELWEWEDSSTTTPQKIGDYDIFGWAYFKISHCGQIWIDHMTFGKSYDGQIDYANPVSNTSSTKFRLAYGSDGTNGLHISFCNFNAGSDDKDGYLYKMMNDMEIEYQEGKTNFLYYNALRNSGITFEEILYGMAMPQKKGFLLGDNASYGSDDYNYNLQLRVSFNSCKFINFADRIPKVRGGDCYMYNCLVDSSQYYEYRTILRDKGADQAVKTVNSTWKAALVSQGIVLGCGAYVRVENTIFRGVVELAKNNDNINNNSGFIDLINFSYQIAKDTEIKVGSTRGENPVFKYSQPALCVPSVEWPKEDGVKPFEISAIDLDEIEEYLNNPYYGSGIIKTNDAWLKVNY